jgi:hypothetical protein
MEQTNMGWECPKCGRCYSPHKTECSHCPEIVQQSNDTLNTVYNYSLAEHQRPLNTFHSFTPDEYSSEYCKICSIRKDRHPMWPHRVR